MTAEAKEKGRRQLLTPLRPDDLSAERQKTSLLFFGQCGKDAGILCRRLGQRGLAANQADLETYISETVGGVWCPSCTCPVGQQGDTVAVTDHRGKVRGLDGLYVSDASIMPTIPCADTNVPTIRIAEKSPTA